MLDYTKYENKLKFPDYNPYKERKELKELLKNKNLSPAQQMRIQELEAIINPIEEQERLYHEENARLYKLWKDDMFEEYGVKDNPKVEKAFSIAWDYGHSNGGYENVECYFSDLVDLIK